MSTTMVSKNPSVLTGIDGRTVEEDPIDLLMDVGVSITASGSHIELVNTFQRMRALKSEWNQLADILLSPLIRHEWFIAAAEALCRESDLRVIVIRRNGECVAVAPLVRSGIGPFTRYEFIGAKMLGEPTGLLYRDSAALAELIDVLVDMRLPIMFDRLHKASPEASVIQDRFKGYQWVSTSGTPWLFISSSWTAYEQRLSSHRKSTIRRYWKRSRTEGTVVVNITTSTVDQIDDILTTFARVEDTGWKQDLGTSMASLHGLQTFFSRFLRSMALNGMVQVGTFFLNGKEIAMILALEHKHRLWILKTGFDQSYARFSPGTLLFHEMVHQAFDRQLDAVEFLGSDEPWLHLWTERVHSQLTVRTYPRNLTGTCALAKDVMDYVLRHCSNLKHQGSHP